MAKVWFSVIFLVLFHQVTAYRDCMNLDNIQNCDECIRCGANWCNNPKEERRCSREKNDDWCTGYEEVVQHLWKKEPGSHFSSKYILQTINVGKDDDVTVTYPLVDADKVQITYNSTQNSHFQISNETTCSSDSCITKVNAAPRNSFCARDGRFKEFITAKINLKGIEEEVTIDFHVPCACLCSEAAEKQSAKCSGRGNYSCGVCTCDKGWEGNACELESCDAKRGDVPFSDCVRNGMECSGNGICGRCDRCECFTDRPGSRYFSKDNFCASICMTINDCDDCFLNKTKGQCPLCHFNLYNQLYNESMIEEKDSLGRQLWIDCYATVQGCDIGYVAKEDVDGWTYFMINKNSCDLHAYAYVRPVSVTLPLVLGLLTVLLLTLMVVGYVIWHQRRPEQCVTPDYQTVGAEGCTGENPLYRPPTSSFKNPTYGKL